jgi:four helix bundle protein
MATARKHEELECWQLADELKARIYTVLERPAVKNDRDFCIQIRKSVRSAPALMAEGFARRATEFKRYLEMALGELGETRNHLRDGAQCRHLGIEEFRELWHLCYRARGATLGLLKYLERYIEAEGKRKRSAQRQRRVEPDV